MKIFLSCVSSQLKECRDALASDLRAIGAEVIVQEDFQQHGRSLLEKLEEHVSTCDRFIALVGDAYGWEPDPTTLREVRRSYTQWEYEFAIGERLAGPAAPPKEIFVYLASASFLDENKVAQSEEAAGLQASFVTRLRSSGKDHNIFHSTDALRALVLRDGFRIQSRESVPRNLPFNTLGRLFKGREGVLLKLKDRLVNSAGADHSGVLTPVPALNGLGGVGKTRLAVEFAWRNQDAFTALLFVAADSPADLRSNLAALTGPLVLDLKLQNDEKEEIRIGGLLRWLSEHPGWFLIVDNVDTEASALEVEKLLTRLQGGRVLVTSRIKHWSAMVEPLDLDVLSETDSRDFILERTDGARVRSPNDESEAAALAHELDGLALGLEQAAAYIGKRRMRICDYRAKLNETASPLLRWHDGRLMGYPKSVAITWQASTNQVSPPANDLLKMLSWYGPEAIPLGLFAAEPSTEEERLDALCELESFSLVRRNEDGDSVTLHRLVQEITREDQVQARIAPEDSAAPVALIHGLRLLAAKCPDDPDDAIGWRSWSELEPHVSISVDFALKWGGPDPTATLARGLGSFLFSKAAYAEAEDRLRQALKLDLSERGSSSREAAHDLSRLSCVLRFMGRLEEAQSAARQALEVDESHTPHDATAISRDLINIGEVLYLQGRLDEREPLYRRAYEIRQSHYGPEHRLVAESLNNLASALQDLKRMDEAEKNYRKSIAISERVLPPDDHEPAIWLNNLASLLEETGRHAEAENAYRRSVSIFETGRVPNHPTLAVSLLNLSAILMRSGRSQEAIECRRRSLSIREKYLGTAHKDTVTSAWLLLESQLKTGDLPGTVMTLSLLIPTLGTPANEANPAILVHLLRQLIAVFESRADHALLATECSQLLTQALAIAAKLSQGDASSDFNDAAKAAEQRGDWNEAERIYRQGLIYNPFNHILLGNLAFLLQHIRRDFPAAEETYLKTLANTPDDAINHVNYAALCLEKGNFSEAETHLATAKMLYGATQDHYAARIAFLESLLALCRGRDPGPNLANLERLMDSGVAFASTSLAQVFESLSDALAVEDRAFLQEVEEALRSKPARLQLQQEERWQSLRRYQK